MAEQAKVPAIRFAGFTDPWEQRKASEVFQIVDDRGHPTLPVLSATQNQGMIYRDDSGRYIGHDESNEIGYKRVLPGDFVVHLRSFQGGFAHSQYEGITSPAYTVFRAKEPTSHSDRFWKHWFMSEHFIAGLSTVTYGIRDGRSISVDEFMNTFLAFPAVEEQAAISRLFDYLDDLITLHQRKYDKLVIFKKSMLEKMFPKDGESVPEIRFAGFTDPWEQRKFSEIVDVCSGRDYKHLDEGPIPVYGTGGYMTSVSEALSHNRDAIGIGRKGTIDKPYLLKAPFWTVDTLFYAIPKSDINLEFALCSFLNVDWKSKDESTGLPSLSKESINETVLSVPNVVEQNHLGNFFADLDRLITLHQRKLELLQNIKKSLLDKMFV